MHRAVAFPCSLAQIIKNMAHTYSIYTYIFLLCALQSVHFSKSSVLKVVQILFQDCRQSSVWCINKNTLIDKCINIDKSWNNPHAVACACHSGHLSQRVKYTPVCAAYILFSHWMSLWRLQPCAWVHYNNSIDNATDNECHLRLINSGRLPRWLIIVYFK